MKSKLLRVTNGVPSRNTGKNLILILLYGSTSWKRSSPQEDGVEERQKPISVRTRIFWVYWQKSL
ncbi:MAG: hypothetical protein DRO11_06395 [Methanobacteriota archaeon]|nr:MAG: hypothetical protein DRO11_06395 [Euryarchaeota archaeon]